MSGNPEDAEDLAQETFVAAFQGISGFRAEAAFGTWLYRKRSGDSAEVEVNGVLFGRGEVVTIAENFGVRLTDLVAK